MADSENEAEAYEGLMERFPVLFQNRNRPDTESCMAWGIECPSGWFRLLERLCTSLEYLNIEFGREWHRAIVADQVKEKFGTLCFYFHIASVDGTGTEVDRIEIDLREEHCKVVEDELRNRASVLINEATSRSETTCAECGWDISDGSGITTRGWISHLCKACFNRRNGLGGDGPNP